MSGGASLAPSKSREILPLTGMRGVAATTVVLYHLSHMDLLSGDALGTFVGKGYLAVDLFFVLSGFVLGLSYGERFASVLKGSTYRDFMIRRLARIYPMYFVVSIVSLIRDLARLHARGSMSYSWVETLGNFLMLQSWGLGLRSVSGPTWSLSAEFFAYLTFPAFVALTLRPGPAIRAAVAALACIGVAVVALSGLGVRGPLDVVAPDSLLPLLRCVAEFALGLIAYRAVRAPITRQMLSSNLVTLLSVAVIVGFCAVPWGDALAVLAMPVLIVNLYYQPAAARAVFGNRVVHHLGAISYSIYLVHPFLLVLVTWIASRHLLAPSLSNDAILIGFYLSSVWAVAFVCYKFVELPGTRLGPRSRRPIVATPHARAAG